MQEEGLLYLNHANVPDHIVCLFGRKGSTTTEHVNKANCNHTINVENEVSLLLGGNLLDGQSKVENGVILKVIERKLLDNLDTLVWIRKALDAVTDSHNQYILLSHLLQVAFS